MAVTFNKSNVIIVTAAGGAQQLASGDIQAGGYDQLRIRKLRWVTTSAPTAGDNCQLLDDAAGVVVWEAVAASTDRVNHESDFVHGNDFRAADLTGLHAIVDSGILYIYLGDGRNTY